MGSIDNPATVEQMHTRFLREALTQRANDLRHIADEFDRLAGEVDGSNDYSMIANRAVHSLMWGIANLGIERVAKEAGDAEVARAKGE